MPVTQTNNSETVKDLLWPKHRTRNIYRIRIRFVSQICETFRRAGFRDCYLSLLDDRRYVQRFFSFLFFWKQSRRIRSENEPRRIFTAYTICISSDQILSIVSIYHDQYFWSNCLTFFSKKKRKEKERLKDQLEGLERSDGNVDGSLICIRVGESVPILLESST